MRILDKLLNRNDPKEGLFFIFKFWIMKSIETSIFLAIIFFLGSINLLQAVLIGVPLIASSFAIGRCLEKRIDMLAARAAKGLGRFPRARRIIVKYM